MTKIALYAFAASVLYLLIQWLLTLKQRRTDVKYKDIKFHATSLTGEDLVFGMVEIETKYKKLRPDDIVEVNGEIYSISTMTEEITPEGKILHVYLTLQVEV